MKKVYQTIIDPGKGNCLQAAVASIFEMELDEVPHFIEFGKDWWKEMSDFYISKGYRGVSCYNPENNKEITKKVLEFDKGVNGHWVVSVPSQTFKNVSHAVVMDKNLNIVHDPNPNEKALSLTFEDIEQIDTVNTGWYINEKGTIISDP